MDQEIGDQAGIKSEATAVSTGTIVALASGALPAAIAVIRVSGPKTRNVLETFCGGVPAPRHATLRDIGPPRLPAIDRGLLIWFPAPASFTGEDMAELHTHGSRAVVSEVIEAVLSLDGTRLAEPGEFARRAFENGKLDLTQVEGLADLISAETEAQRWQALAQAEGSLRALYEGWRAELLVEAGLDFADEGDVAADVALKAEAIVTSLLASISHHLADRRGERLRDGVRIVIAGPPNVGKSSLLNALAKRDVLEVHLDLGGLPVILTDTAGLRETESKVEAEGVRRALSRTEQADVVLWLVDATAPVWEPPVALGTKPAICILNKIDLGPQGTSEDCIQISAKTGQGLDRLIEVLEEQAALIAGTGSGAPLMTRARHRVELEDARTALQRFGDAPLRPELRAEELRIAAHHVGRLTGRIDVEEVLGAIFGEFCIGK